MRIIAGKARGTILQTPKGEDTRPTLGRVKENYFNAVNFDLEDAKVLDLFAGSGQLGLEALSRGARTAVFIDSNPECIDIIIKNAQKAKLYNQCAVLKYDYSEYLSALKKRRDFKESDKFGIVFADPPYNHYNNGYGSADIIKDCVRKLIKNKFMADGGLIICETGSGERPDLNFEKEPEISESIKNVRVYKYGRVYITILKV
ncbi:MAG: 16S rRNA (guanine(966)-N(2))-methyltransferase RsmD [Oscillospiraceae bacterium]|nr:16S rRNA (guanine(966)-N(2))-methyltransferase RsmD [Oscillospiraceae bacterium]